jgi:predicted RNase H-like HicB family nuclease
MQYQVFVQSYPENKFIASIVGIPNTTVEGSTKEEVIVLAKTTLETQLATGELVTIEVGKEHYHLKLILEFPVLILALELLGLLYPLCFLSVEQLLV